MSNTANLFEQDISSQKSAAIPLAERVRPKTFEQVVGHLSYFKKGSALRQQIESGMPPSIIFWGPPGVGKTTLARVVARVSGLPFSMLSAVTSGKKDLALIINRATAHFKQYQQSHLLFIDEIHRYNKAQQDGLLHAVENGILKLIGATTENPSFEVIAPLLSRCQVIRLQPLSAPSLKQIILNALQNDLYLSELSLTISGMNDLLHYGSGDARRTLNLLESCISQLQKKSDKTDLCAELIKETARYNALLYDKGGDYHYDTISAFIKSIRGSDPDAAVYYLARMLAAGEDPVYIARRMIILASEDIGNAEPYALSLATAALNAVQAIGMPEARIILSQVATYLASCPKSNAAYLAIEKAQTEVENHPALSIPLHLRNAPTQLMKEMGYGQKYRYPHDYPGHFIREKYLPEELTEKIFYHPTEQGREKALLERLLNLWPKRKPVKKVKSK